MNCGAGYVVITRSQKIRHSAILSQSVDQINVTDIPLSPDAAIGYAVTDEVKERALSVVEVVLDGYRRGIFPPRPKVHSHLYDCPSCQPDGADRLTKEGFELLLQADELADYRAVIDE